MQFPEFTPAETAVFRYHDGEKMVAGDPLDLHRRICFLLGNPGKVVDEICNADAAEADEATVRQGMAASEKLCTAVREAFQLVEFDRATGKGATEAHVLGLWNHFARAITALKKNTAPPLTTSPPTASSTATPATTASTSD